MARIRAAAANPAGLTPRGPLPPYPEPLAGVVWHRPDTLATALAELLALRQAGVRSVRTALVEDTLVLRAADLLGIAVWQDLPVANLPAARLRDTVAFAERQLAAALLRAAPFRSARHFGLALYADTSDPAARPYFERLAALVRARGPEGARTYYVSRFPDDDRCDRLVDLVLLDARDADPAEVLRRWRRRHDTPVGLGALGAALIPGRDGGWRVPGTPAAQARALERGLGTVLQLEAPPEALFVYRWRDRRDTASPLAQSAEVGDRRYGLFDEEGTARPAFAIVRGFFTGTQWIFAFDAGRAAPEAQQASVLVLLGWVVLLGLGLLYALTPRFGLLAPRYFRRHDLYRESIQRGYDLDFAPNALAGMGLALAAGVVGAAALRGLARTDALAAATAGPGPAFQGALTRLLGAPLLLVAVLAALYALWLLLNLLWLLLLAGRRRRIRPPQAVTLAVWSRWPVLVLLLAAMALTALSPRAATAFAPTLLLAWLVAEVLAAGRMLYDFGRVTRVPPGRALGLGFAAPVGLAFVLLALALLRAGPEIAFLWHLATRS